MYGLLILVFITTLEPTCAQEDDDNNKVHL